MRSSAPALLLAIVVSATPLWAASSGTTGQDLAPPRARQSSSAVRIYDQLFFPKLVMEHQREIGLRPAQADAIKRAMADTQQQIVELQWKLDAESEALGGLLTTDHVDEKAVMANLERLNAIEQQAKTVNFTLLVRIKNQLDAEQQAKLRALRPSRSSGAPRRLPPAGAPFLDS